MAVTASKLYDYLQCPHRVWRDAHGPQGERDPEPNPFVQLLWERGVRHEQKQLAQAGQVVDIASFPYGERPARTLAALHAGAPMIYQGMLQVDDLIGIPDFLRREPDGSYLPIDVKSGMGAEGVEADDEGPAKLRKPYAVQLALYVDSLRRLGFAVPLRGIILDVRGEEVPYDLLALQGGKPPETYWALYERLRDAVRALLTGETSNTPAMIGVCKLCPWYDSCSRWVQATDDPSGLFKVGRRDRDALARDALVTSIDALCRLDVAGLVARKTKSANFLKGIGRTGLEKAVRRARVYRETKAPVLYATLVFPETPYELFFDIEDDPTQDFVYMHGVLERSARGERYLDFTATEVSESAERDAWQRFWNYIGSLPADAFTVYYYSKHERTAYRKLREKYPDIVSEDALERFFGAARAIDLYGDIVAAKTDWPLGSYSIKAIAQYLGFRWRDESPSGALSILWFNEYIAGKDPAVLERIRQYNEDDCRATLVLKDALVRMNAEREAHAMNPIHERRNP
ncbi:MAG: TM0106 family RecB-like putative nuclease [Betaproteobacteria bacterium]